MLHCMAITEVSFSLSHQKVRRQQGNGTSDSQISPYVNFISSLLGFLTLTLLVVLDANKACAGLYNPMHEP